jgi:hypothetical protein
MKMPPGLRITSTAGEESGRSGKSASAGAGEALRFANGAVLTDADLDAVSGSMWMSNVGEAMFGMNGGVQPAPLQVLRSAPVLVPCTVARPRRRTLLFADIMVDELVYSRDVRHNPPRDHRCNRAGDLRLADPLVRLKF